MRKIIFPAAMAATVLLGGCAAGLGGADPLGGLIGSVLGGGLSGQGYGNVNAQFQDAAVNACGQQASRYGQVSVTGVQQVRSDILRVDGRVGVSGGYQQRSFTCSFRSDGRIVDFRIN